MSRMLAVAFATTLVLQTAVSAARLELRLQDDFGPFISGDTVTVGLWMTDLGDAEASGFQAFLAFDVEGLSFVEGGYTDMPFGLTILPIFTSGENGDQLNLAAGVIPGDQGPTSADAQLATIVFEALGDFCRPPLSFRDNKPPTTVSSTDGQPILPLELLEFPPSACAADLDGDGHVAFGDLLIVLSSWGGACPGDVNNSGQVAFDDLLIVLSNWGPCGP